MDGKVRDCDGAILRVIIMSLKTLRLKGNIEESDSIRQASAPLGVGGLECPLLCRWVRR